MEHDIINQQSASLRKLAKANAALSARITKQQDEISALSARLERMERERDAAVEAITSLSVCDKCKSHCEGDDECIDNGYMNFEWRGLEGSTCG